MKEDEIRPEVMARLINAGKQKSFQVDIGSGYGSELARSLKNLGFKHRKTYSECKVATFKEHLQKNNTAVEIISSHFMGNFTEVRVYGVR